MQVTIDFVEMEITERIRILSTGHNGEIGESQKQRIHVYSHLLDLIAEDAPEIDELLISLGILGGEASKFKEYLERRIAVYGKA